MKNNNGITLIALTVTIIVIIIIASVGTYSGMNSLREATERKQIAEVGVLQQAILENYTKYLTTKNNVYIRGTQLTYAAVQTIITEINNNRASTENEIALKMYNYDTGETPTVIDYYYELKVADLKDMGISGEEIDEYIVNYKTGEVINKTTKVTRSGIPLYIYAISNLED